MDHFAKIAARLEGQGLDAVLLTEEANRFYASGFHSTGTDGIALVTRRGNYYFTDARYTEAAERRIRDAQIREVEAGGRMSLVDGAVLAAVNIADQYFKEQESGENLRRQIKESLEESARLKAELSEAKREIYRLQNRK